MIWAIEFEQLAPRLIVAVAGLAMVIALGIYLIGRFRRTDDLEGLTAHEMLGKFREWHDQGELSDAEFRTIKTMLSERLQNELKNDAKKG